MKILNTSIFLFLTIIIVPIISYYFGTPLGELEWNTLNTLILVAVFAASTCFIIGELTHNNSQVDKLWSLLPIVYMGIIAEAGEFSPRLIIMWILVAIWGIRLTFNFALKGAYQWKFWEGAEDYRWKILRQKPEFKPRWKWTLFNLFFICIYQNALILFFTLPGLVALQFNDVPVGIYDFIIAIVMLAFIILETLADLQQWKFQSIKWKKIKAGETLTGDYQKGFLDKGLWAYSRHPNYFAEQSLWLCFYLFSISASGQWINWSLGGALLLVLLFQGSSKFSEEISASKYILYKDYQRRVSRFIPKLGDRK